MPALFAELPGLAYPPPLITKSKLDQSLLRPLREHSHLRQVVEAAEFVVFANRQSIEGFNTEVLRLR